MKKLIMRPIEVGDIVYAPYAPRNPGKVIAIGKRPFRVHGVLPGVSTMDEVADVIWTNPVRGYRKTNKSKETTILLSSLTLLEFLISQHQQTIDNLKKRLKKAKDL